MIQAFLIFWNEWRFFFKERNDDTSRSKSLSQQCACGRYGVIPMCLKRSNNPSCRSRCSAGDSCRIVGSGSGDNKKRRLQQTRVWLQLATSIKEVARVVWSWRQSLGEPLLLIPAQMLIIITITPPQTDLKPEPSCDSVWRDGGTSCPEGPWSHRPQSDALRPGGVHPIYRCDRLRRNVTLGDWWQHVMFSSRPGRRKSRRGVRQIYLPVWVTRCSCCRETRNNLKGESHLG